MQHAVALSGEDDDEASRTSVSTGSEFSLTQSTTANSLKSIFSNTWFSIKYLFYILHPTTIQQGYQQVRQLTFMDLIKGLFSLLSGCVRLFFFIIACGIRYVKGMKISLCIIFNFMYVFLQNVSVLYLFHDA